VLELFKPTERSGFMARFLAAIRSFFTSLQPLLRDVGRGLLKSLFGLLVGAYIWTYYAGPPEYQAQLARIGASFVIGMCGLLLCFHFMTEVPVVKTLKKSVLSRVLPKKRKKKIENWIGLQAVVALFLWIIIHALYRA